jgi:hypothetical protein
MEALRLRRATRRTIPCVEQLSLASRELGRAASQRRPRSSGGLVKRDAGCLETEDLESTACLLVSLGGVVQELASSRGRRNLWVDEPRRRGGEAVKCRARVVPVWSRRATRPCRVSAVEPASRTPRRWAGSGQFGQEPPARRVPLFSTKGPTCPGGSGSSSSSFLSSSWRGTSCVAAAVASNSWHGGRPLLARSPRSGAVTPRRERGERQTQIDPLPVSE